jgi:hypothetical protein
MTRFRTITGSDWKRSIVAARIRREQRKDFAARAYSHALSRLQSQADFTAAGSQSGMVPDRQLEWQQPGAV